jgi:hypothetical protein
MASAEPIQTAYKLESNFERSRTKCPAMIGIYQIWVHGKFRKQGIAASLLDTIRETMVFGMAVGADKIAFSSPTEAGVQFARAYVQKSDVTDVLVYDSR